MWFLLASTKVLDEFYWWRSMTSQLVSCVWDQGEENPLHFCLSGFVKKEKQKLEHLEKLEVQNLFILFLAQNRELLSHFSLFSLIFTSFHVNNSCCALDYLHFYSFNFWFGWVWCMLWLGGFLNEFLLFVLVLSMILLSMKM